MAWDHKKEGTERARAVLTRVKVVRMADSCILKGVAWYSENFTEEDLMEVKEKY